MCSLHLSFEYNSLINTKSRILLYTDAAFFGEWQNSKCHSSGCNINTDGVLKFVAFDPHQNSCCACSKLICLPTEMRNYFLRTCIHSQQYDCHCLSCMGTSLYWDFPEGSVRAVCVANTAPLPKIVFRVCVCVSLYFGASFKILCPLSLFFFTSRKT